LVAGNTYQPERGDLAWLDFTPHSGSEQAGRRPALILSAQEFNIATGMAFVCPITNQGKGSNFEVPLPRGAKMTGFVLTHQLKSLDWIAREADFAGKLNQETLWEVFGRIEAIMSIEL
jgi:mRNA interferase MazF